jgi:DNA-directed RNA polymerase specialized sigma24 family protein
MKKTFLHFYDTTVNDLYAYCYKRLADRNLAKAVTEDSYKYLWSTLTSTSDIAESEDNLFRIANQYIRQHFHVELSSKTRLTPAFS